MLVKSKLLGYLERDEPADHLPAKVEPKYNYQVYARVYRDDPQRILAVTVRTSLGGRQYPYSCHVDFTVFCDGKNTLTRRRNKNSGWPEGWTKAAIESITPYIRNAEIWYADELSEKCGEGFFGKPGETLRLISEFQQAKLSAALEQIRAARRKRVDEIMNQMGERPADLGEWTNEVAFGFSRYIYYRRQGKTVKGYCTECRSEIEQPAGKGTLHNRRGICPNCGREITFKAVGKSTRVCDWTHFGTLERIRGGLLLRCYEGYRSYCSGHEEKKDGHWGWVLDSDYHSPKTEYWEMRRYFVADDGKTRGYERYMGDEWHEFSSFAKDFIGYLYTGNLDILQDTPWKFSGIGDFAEHVGPFNIENFLVSAISYPSVEYLVKLGFYRLLKSKLGDETYAVALRLNGKAPGEILQVDKQDIDYVRRMDFNCRELIFFRGLRKQGTMLPDAYWEWLRKVPCDHRNFYCLRNYLNVRPAVNYFRKICPSGTTCTCNLISDYKDYLDMAKQLGYDMKSKSVLFPRNIKKAHDAVNKLLQVKKDKETDGKIRKREAELNRKYAFEADGLLIRAPRDMGDFIDEGSMQNNCVARMYMKPHAKGSTDILFMRRADDPDKSFCTVEICKGEIQQFRAKDNKEPPADAKKFMRKFEKEKLPRKEKATVVSVMGERRRVLVG